METGLAKLRALEVIGLSADDMALVRAGNAVRIFPPGSLVHGTGSGDPGDGDPGDAASPQRPGPAALAAHD